MVLALNGLAWSTGTWRTAARNGRAHQRCAVAASTAKIGLPGRKAATKQPSAKLRWFTT